MKPAPLCRYCGGPIAKQTRLVWLEKKEEPHHSTSDFSRYAYPGDRDNWPKTKDDCKRFTNWHIASVKRGMWGEGFGEINLTYIRSFTEWDGESYRDEFFCNGDHARKFGYLFARGGHCTDKYNKALAIQTKASRGKE